MKNMKKFLGIGFSAMMLISAATAPAGAETSGQTTGAEAAVENGAAVVESRPNGKAYNYALILPNQKTSSIVRGSKIGPSSRGSEQSISEIENADTLIYFIKVSGKQKTDETSVSVGDNYLEYNYASSETYTGSAELRGKNARKSGYNAHVTGIANFN
ncbi:conserved exported protein of unknown function [Ruminococcaceae bacterium BL-6]|nr:conserved exported protein of unknown function [Ruminococcaceae bacterium BL-6]